MVWLSNGEKKFDDKFSCFDRIPTCDGQTDRQADILRQRSLRALMLQPVMTIMLLIMLNNYDVHGGPKTNATCFIALIFKTIVVGPYVLNVYT